MSHLLDEPPGKRSQAAIVARLGVAGPSHVVSRAFPSCASSSPALQSPGREVEQQLVADALAGAAGNLPCAVVVRGEAGVGKTRLVREACEH